MYDDYIELDTVRQIIYWFDVHVGSVSLNKLQKLIWRFFEGSRQQLTNELSYMLMDRKVLAERITQIEICADLDQYHNGAEVMMDMKSLFNLTGDFSAMEKILQSVCYHH